MIADHEVAAFVAAEESATASQARRAAAAEDRRFDRAGTKFILSMAAGAAALALLGKEAVDYNRAHSANTGTPAADVRPHR